MVEPRSPAVTRAEVAFLSVCNFQTRPGTDGESLDELHLRQLHAFPHGHNPAASRGTQDTEVHIRTRPLS